MSGRCLKVRSPQLYCTLLALLYLICLFVPQLYCTLLALLYLICLIVPQLYCTLLYHSVYCTLLALLYLICLIVPQRVYRPEVNRIPYRMSFNHSFWFHIVLTVHSPTWNALTRCLLLLCRQSWDIFRGWGKSWTPPPPPFGLLHGLKLYRLNDENMTNSCEWRRKSRPNDKNVHRPDLPFSFFLS